MEVRPARHEDVPSVVAWTTRTFDWGDYVPERFDAWIDDPDSQPVVCVDDDGAIIGVGNTVMVSPTEAWLEAARVHPEHRRRGIGSTMNAAGISWAKECGARVARLATEADNTAARRQVEAMGYRHTSTWVDATLSPEQRAPVAGTRGLTPAPSADVDAAWLSWVSGDLARAGQEMITQEWRWRQARQDDLVEAARSRRFFQSPSGWVIADHPEPDMMGCGWLATGADTVLALLDDVLETARAEGVREITIRAPSMPWMTEALIRVGDEPVAITVYSLTI